MAGLGSTPKLRTQLALIAGLRWRLFRNSLRSTSARLDLLGLIAAASLAGVFAAGIGLALGTGAYFAVVQGRPERLGLLLWAVFLLWHFLPVMLAGFSLYFDFRNLLRFPLRFSVLFLLSLAYGLADPAAVAGLFWLICIAAGLGMARLNLLPWAVLALAVFAAMNLLLSCLISSWIERLLARRRAREAFGALILLLLLSLQFSGIFAERWGRRAVPAVARLTPVLSVLPPGLAGKALAGGARGNAAEALVSTALLAGYGLACGLLLRRRIRAQYLGEDLGETPAPVTAQASSAPAVSYTSFASAFLAGPVAAVCDKELRYLFRNAPMLLTLAVPVVLVAFLMPAWSRPRHGPLRSAVPGELVFPIAVGYVLLLLTNLSQNCLAYDGRGIQLLFVAPVRFREVLLGKNLVHALVVAVETLVVWVAVSLTFGPPRTLMLLTTLAALLFATLINFAVGDLLSLYFPRRLEFGVFRRQRAAGMTVLIPLGTNLVVFAMAAFIFVGTGWLGRPWLAVAVFLGLSAAAWQAYKTVLESCSRIAADRREVLTEQLAR